MKSIILILIISLICSQTNSLHINPNSILHEQTAAEQQAYLAELLKIENTLKQQLNDFEVFANTINNNVTAYEGSPTIQTQLLEFGIDSERDKLWQMSGKLVLPLDKRTWDCKLLTQNEVDAINKQISDTQKNVAVLQQKIDA